MTGAESPRWLIKSPPCCHSIGSIWVFNLLTVSAQTVVVGSRFHWLTTLCEKKYFRLLRCTILLGDGILVTSPTCVAQWEEVFTLEAFN